MSLPWKSPTQKPVISDGNSMPTTCVAKAATGVKQIAPVVQLDSTPFGLSGSPTLSAPPQSVPIVLHNVAAGTFPQVCGLHRCFYCYNAQIR